MAQNSWPSPTYNSRNVTDLEYEQLAAKFSDDGVYGDPTDDAVVTAGVGLNVDIRADVYASVRGHAWTSGTTGDTLAISANASGQSRTDRIVLRLDRSTWNVRAVVLQGTPGAGSPALTQDTGSTGVYEILLAGVVVPDGATSVTVIRGELYVGSRVRPTTVGHPNPLPVLGEMQYETDTGRLRLYDGSAWRTVYSDSGVVVINSPLSSWDIATESIIEERNGNVHLRLGSFERAGGTLASTADSRLPVLIPPQFRPPNRDRFLIAYVEGLQIARITVYSAASSRPGQVWLTQHPTISKGQGVLTSGISWVV